MGDRLRWGILSTARIAGTVFVPGVRASAETEVLTVGSRSLGAARSSYTLYSAHPPGAARRARA